MFCRRNHGSYVWWAQLFLFPSLFFCFFVPDCLAKGLISSEKKTLPVNLFGVNTFYHEGGVLLIKFYVASVIFILDFFFFFLPVWIPGKHLLNN